MSIQVVLSWLATLFGSVDQADQERVAYLSASADFADFDHRQAGIEHAG